MTFYRPYINDVCELAIKAGRGIMRYYESGEFSSVVKEDHSPVTEADLAANTYIVNALNLWTPDIAVVSEEGERPQFDDRARFWIVDPLDGTKSFIRKSDEFTVNIALIDEGEPVFGVLYVPVTGVLYYGSRDFGAFRQKPKDAPRKITVRQPSEEGLDVVVSQAHKHRRVEEFLEGKLVRHRHHASSSLKFGLVAEGSYDLYPRLGRTMEWDTAAGQAIVEAAGGQVTTFDGQRLRYGKPGYENPDFVVWGKTPQARED